MDSTFGWWEDIDPSTSSGSVTGDIANSTHARNFDSQGEPLWVIFISEYSDMKIGVSRDSVVFYGAGWSEADMEQYIYQIILPNI